MMMGFVPQPILQDRDRTTIGHDSFVEDNIFASADYKFSSPTQVGVTKVDIFETDFAKSSIPKNGSGKIGVFKANLPENSVGKVNSFHKAILETTFVHPNPTKIGETQISVPKMPSIKVGFAKVGSVVDTASEAFISKISPPKTLPSEILFSPSVEPEQFFSIHNTTPESIDNINNSALSLWNSIIQPQSSFDPYRQKPYFDRNIKTRNGIPIFAMTQKRNLCVSPVNLFAILCSLNNSFQNAIAMIKV